MCSVICVQNVSAARNFGTLRGLFDNLRMTWEMKIITFRFNSIFEFCFQLFWTSFQIQNFFFFSFNNFFWSFIFNYEVFYNTNEIKMKRISMCINTVNSKCKRNAYIGTSKKTTWRFWVKVELQRTQLNFLLITHGFFTFENEQLLNKCDFKLRFRVKEALQLLQVNFFGNFGSTKSEFKPGHRFKMWTFRLLLRVNEALQLAQTNRSFTSLIFFIL